MLPAAHQAELEYFVREDGKTVYGPCREDVLHAWIAEGMQIGYLEILPDVAVEGLPPLNELKR